jgi:hypothetical protein
MFSAFKFFLCSHAQSIEVSCAGLFQVLDMEVKPYHDVCYALTDQYPVVGLTVYSLCKDIVMEYSYIQK